MHLVSNPDDFLKAMDLGFLYFHTACGKTVPTRDLTTEPARVTCMNCERLIVQLMESVRDVPPTLPESLPSDFELDPDLFDAVDSVQDGPILVQGEVESDGGLEDQLKGVAALVEQMIPMLSFISGDCKVVPGWQDLLNDPEDPSLVDAEMVALRSLLPASDLTLIRSLHDLGKGFGLDPLFALVVSILHRQLMARKLMIQSVESSSMPEDGDGVAVDELEVEDE